jgi:hypothetical protein
VRPADMECCAARCVVDAITVMVLDISYSVHLGPSHHNPPAATPTPSGAAPGCPHVPSCEVWRLGPFAQPWPSKQRVFHERQSAITGSMRCRFCHGRRSRARKMIRQAPMMRSSPPTSLTHSVAYSTRLSSQKLLYAAVNFVANTRAC